jgi:hypothetical protein
MTEKLDGIRSIEPWPMQEPIVAYKIQLTGRDVYVAWSQDGARECSIPLRASRVQVTHIITTLNQTKPKTEKLFVKNGVLKLKISLPIFLEPLIE